MKHIPVLLLVFLPSCLYAQTINNMPIKNLKTNYFEIYHGSVGTSITTYIHNFGRESYYNAASSNEYVIRNSNGNVINFGNLLDWLNFWDQNGYEFVQTYTTPETGRGFFTVTMMRKKSASVTTPVSPVDKPIQSPSYPLIRLTLTTAQGVNESYYVSVYQIIRFQALGQGARVVTSNGDIVCNENPAVIEERIKAAILANK